MSNTCFTYIIMLVGHDFKMEKSQEKPGSFIVILL